MAYGLHLVRVGFVLLSISACIQAQVTVAGRVVDETGAGIEAARVEFRAAEGAGPIPVFSDPAGNFQANLPVEGVYAIRAERQGFYLYQGSQSFAAGPSQLTVTLNHEQEFSEKVDVVYSPPPIDPQQTSDPVSYTHLDVYKRQLRPHRPGN